MNGNYSRREVIVKMTTVAGVGVAALCSPVNVAKAINLKGQSINIKVSPPGPNSLAMLEQMKTAIGRTNYAGLYGITLSEGTGAYITDVDGNSYLDCLSAASSNVLGYSHNDIAKSYYYEATTLQNSCLPYSPNMKAIELANKLIDIVPGEYSKRVLLGLSGSDSCGGAIEAMRKYTGKYGIIKFNNAYHGSTGLSQQASGFRALNEGIYPESPYFINLDFPTSEKRADIVLKQIKNNLASENVGGIIAEAIQGDAGVRISYNGFFQKLSEFLSKYKALLIVDEVQSGMGRTGKWWAVEHEGIIPDILQLDMLLFQP